MYDTLFDEKIAGSFHFTPGNAYESADNGNRSALHWDLVSIQTPEYGGGEMYFDGVLVRKDGLFVHDRLVLLNPENLGADWSGQVCKRLGCFVKCRGVEGLAKPIANMK